MGRAGVEGWLDMGHDQIRYESRYWDEVLMMNVNVVINVHTFSISHFFLPPDIQKTLYSSTVCTMIFSTAEAVPLPVYGESRSTCDM